MEIATEFAETWVDAWQTRGGEEFAAWFTEDGVWVDGVGAFDGRTDIRMHVATYGLFTNAELGDIAEVEAGVFVFPIEAVWYDADWVGEVEVRFEGDLVAHAELVTWEEVDSAASCDDRRGTSPASDVGRLARSNDRAESPSCKRPPERHYGVSVELRAR